MSRRFATRRMIGWATGAVVAAISVSGLPGAAVHADGPPGSPPPVPPVVPDAGVLDVGVPDAGVVVAVGLPPVPPVAPDAPDVEDDPSDHQRRDAAVPAAVVETLTSVPAAIDELARRL